uniref:Paxillin n=1 Tax=Felis catus TaxID=9685 RepID=A0ABI7ZWV9_FELCA
MVALRALSPSPSLAVSASPPLSRLSLLSLLSFVFLLLQTSSSAVALSSPELLPKPAPSPHLIRSPLPPPPPPPPPPPGPSVFLPSITKPSSGGHSPSQEVLCSEDTDNGRGLLPPVAPNWLDLAGLWVTPDTPNSGCPSVEGSLGPLGAKSQTQVWKDLPNLISELSGGPPCHMLPGQAGCIGPQEPGAPHGLLANPLYPEEAVAATREQPWALEALRPETPHGATCSFQEVTEPAVVAVDRQAIFPDTWSLTKECGQRKQRAKPEPGELESSGPAPVGKEQLGGQTLMKGSLVRPTQGPETPRWPEGVTEAAARREQSELPPAVVTDTPSTTERISTSGQIRSVIRRSRETGHAHPMSREPSPRRRLDPATLSRTPSQERLIAELQGRLGIQPEAEEAAGAAGASAEDWLTEGVIITVQPRGRRAGGQLVEKIQGLEQIADGEAWAAGWPPNGRQSSPEGQDEGGFMAQGKTGSSSPPGGPPKPGSQLDSMLGSLQSDLNKLGVATVAKGVCGACKKPIAGQVVTAMGKTWHPEHFVCTHCQEEIGSRNFFERDGQPYCEKDYHNLFSPRCYYCNGPILDKVVTALDRTWHPEHFFCAQCGAFFGPEGFHEKDGKAYCRKDYFDMFAPKCGGCARAILENYISALNTLWHPECFVCRECFTPFVNGSFFEHDGQPYCEVHYHERRGSLCSGCQKPITGRCITAMAKKFHPEHFVCAFCLKQLNKGTFKEQNDKPYCQNCFLKLFC